MTKTAIPVAVVVGPFRYEISTDEMELARAERSERSVLLGHADHDQLRICLKADLARGAIRETVLHETLHAIATTTGLSNEWGHKDEESYIRALSPMLLDVLRRNPSVVAFLTEPEV